MAHPKRARKKRGKSHSRTFTAPNRKSGLKTVVAEKAGLAQDAEKTLAVYAQLLPGLLDKLSRIPDPRDPRKVKHRITVLMLYGILMFAFHRTSRREAWKQDCELKAFYRLAKRLKRAFPKLLITLLLDGLYANGPVLKSCLKNKWHFMIVLKDKSLSTVWEEAKGLLRLDTEGEYRHERQWQGRRQVFRWVNDIEYSYGAGPHAKTLWLHLVTCEETWETTDGSGDTVVKTGHHAWLSSELITRKNVHGLCNLTARKRWLHENNILKEKHHGYSYEHIFSHHWDAMRGYHYLMHIARFLNELVVHSVSLEERVQEMGIRFFIRKFREVLAHRELDAKRLRRLAESPGQLRLVPEESWRRSIA